MLPGYVREHEELVLQKRQRLLARLLHHGHVVVGGCQGEIPKPAYSQGNLNKNQRERLPQNVKISSCRSQMTPQIVTVIPRSSDISQIGLFDQFVVQSNYHVKKSQNNGGLDKINLISLDLFYQRYKVGYLVP